MLISAGDGSIEFDNIRLRRGYIEVNLPLLAQQGKLTEGVKNKYWATYFFLYALDGAQPYTLSLTFYLGTLQTVSISIANPDSSWDDVTTEWLEQERRLLLAVMRRLFGNNDLKHTFDWGIVLLTQDFKNSFSPSIHIAYQ